MKRSVFAAFLTTVSRKQAWQSFCLLLQPWKWNNKTSIISFLEAFSFYLVGNTTLSDNQQLIAFYNARSALYHGLQYLGVKSKDLVAVQGYTCVSVINAVKATGAIPLYIDIDEKTLNMDPVKLEALLREKKVKVVIVQHTLGIVAAIDAIRQLCHDYDCKLLEDCAHSLGASYHGKKVGLRGDVSIFSFGRDKIISSVNGGALIINTPNETHQAWYKSIRFDAVSHVVVIKNLLYAIVGYLASVSYDFFRFGKVLYWVSGTSKLFPEIVSQKEKDCAYTDLSFGLPPVLAQLARAELASLDQCNAIRRNTAMAYHQKLGKKMVYVERGDEDIKDVYLRCVYLCKTGERDSLVQDLKAQKIYPGDWYQQLVAPKGVDFERIFYELGSCPVAETIASQTINLPNHAGVGDESIQRILLILMTRNNG